MQIAEPYSYAHGASQLIPPLILSGTLSLYQCYIVGTSINLDQAQTCLTAPTARRHIPEQTRHAGSIKIAHPPLSVNMGTTTVVLADCHCLALRRASLYDLGVIVVTLELTLPQQTSWDRVASLLQEWQDPPSFLLNDFHNALEAIKTVIEPAITPPARATLIEDYSILCVERLEGDQEACAIATHPLVHAALLGEQSPLSPHAPQLITHLSYLANDVALLSWNSALIVDPKPMAATTAAALIEFANVELLLMRAFDATIDAELPRVYQGIEAAQGHWILPLVRRYSRLLSDVQQLIFAVMRVTERVDNALKVTDDVYWNRLYSSMLHVLRVQVWREGVEHKLALLRETYDMLHTATDAERASALELAIVILILVEILLAFLGVF